MNKTLIDYLNDVKDKETFIEFVNALIRDREEAVEREKQAPENHRGFGAFGWQNETIEDYLGMCLACADNNGDEPVLTKEPTWYSFADFLYGGKIYE